MADPCLIEGRLVKPTARKRQVVKIRAAQDAGKMWEYVFEFAADKQHVSRSDIKQHSTVAELVDWLTSLGAVQVEDFTDVQLLSVPPDADWLKEAAALVDAAIDSLVNAFHASPYLHRVEHSLHLHLYKLLTTGKFFSGPYPIGGTNQQTQLIHKEWPETRPRPDKGGRGNFDFAILAPTQLAQANLGQFTGGHIEAAIVIELGMNYDYDHLAGDHIKLIESKATSGYLVDVHRVGKRDPKIETLICTLSNQIKSAYAFAPPRGKGALKHIADDHVRDERS